MSTQYPLIPSHVSVQSFVTVKLSSKCVYGLWKTQMLCLLKSHDMLAFIDESSPLPPVGDQECRTLWNRLDALVHGWILGSLSEQAAITVLNHLKSKHHQHTHHVTAKHIWDQLQSMYGQQAELEEERKGEGCDSTCIDLMTKVKEERDKSRNKRLLYHAVECGMLQQVVSILKNEKIGMTDCISINGNTALHIAATYSSDSFLKSMLNLLPSDILLKDVRNKDGSTPLHLAASLGNTNAAKILLDRSQDLLYAKDNEGCTPLDIVLSRPWKKEMYLLLMNSQTPDIEQANTTYAGHEPLVNAIAYRHFDLALTLIQRCNSLKKSRAVLMAIAQNCPADFTPNELITYELFQRPVLEFVNRGTSNMKSCMKLANLVLKLVLAYPYKMLIQIGMKLQVLEDLRERMKERRYAQDLLHAICYLIRISKAEGGDFYREAMLEAIRRDASDAVEIIVHWFPKAALMVDEDGHNIAQAAWKSRASKVYALILDSNLAKKTSVSHNARKQRQDECGNNFLHFAARLAPAKKTDPTSWPPFRMQRELQWFKLAQDMLPQGRAEKNSFGETPEMVFKKEHKDLEIESRDWIKSASNAVAITTTLIITVMFTAAIQAPGGNGDKGLPNMIGQPAFIAFETSITISAMASCLSLLLFLGILTSPLPPDHFLLRLPLALVTGLVSLFVSVAFGMLAFLAALILIFGTKDSNHHHNHMWVLYFLIPLITLPISLFYYLYATFVSRVLFDFMHSTGHLLIIHAFRRLKLVGRIHI